MEGADCFAGVLSFFGEPDSFVGLAASLGEDAASATLEGDFFDLEEDLVVFLDADTT